MGTTPACSTVARSRASGSVKGYQCDFEDRWHADGTLDRFSGMLFDEAGRTFLAKRGQVTVVPPLAQGEKRAKPRVIGSVGDPAELETAIDREGFNELVIRAVGNQFVHMINGRVMAIVWDEDEQRRRARGVIALQLHSGPPMRIDVKDVTVHVLGH